MLVLIPTAGIGSRLDFNTRYMNKSLLQMGDLPVLSRIIESYPLKTKFITALTLVILRAILSLANPLPLRYSLSALASLRS